MELVESINEVIENVILFNRQIKDDKSNANKTFTRFSNWYYISELDLFAPNKFIGYKRSENNDYSKDGHGSRTKDNLKLWFAKVEQDEPHFQELQNKLVTFANRSHKRISAKTFNNKGGGIFIYSGQLPDYSSPEEMGQELFPEGGVTQVYVNKYERNPKNRAACINAHGLSCYTCGLNFEDRYGSLGTGFIHVHHLKELSNNPDVHMVDPIKDMIPLCPNCHAMVHREKPALHPEKLIEILKR